VIRAEVLGRRVLAALETGANSTDLNANFADLFPDVVASGKKGSSDITGVGGTQTFASVEQPELIFTIGSRLVPLRPAVITKQRNSGAGGECCIANAGTRRGGSVHDHAGHSLVPVGYHADRSRHIRHHQCRAYRAGCLLCPSASRARHRSDRCAAHRVAASHYLFFAFASFSSARAPESVLDML